MKTLLELEPDECRYPMNDGGPYLFCGEATPDKQSYCAEHHEICFRRVTEQLRGRENPNFAAAIRRNSWPKIFAAGPEVVE